jgi:NADH:quinone reductase (non-electrogenic)
MASQAGAERPRIVIIGGGFGGLYAARALARADVQVTLIDRRNHHLFQPLLYQVATAALNPADIAAPIRGVLRGQDNARVVLGEATGIDTARRQVQLDGEAVGYDYLVVAAGATHSYFGHDQWARVAPGLKSIEDALEIRRRILYAYEAAEREPDPARRRAWLTFVVVGGGPTGVEMAGAMAEIAHHALVSDFRRIDPDESRILLVEGQDHVLPSFDARLAPKAQAQLERLGVELLLGMRVTEIDEGGVTLVPVPPDDGAPVVPRRIEARTTIWGAGVAGSPIARSLGVALDRAGRVLVEPDLSIPGRPEVFVIGDLAALAIAGKPVPGVAPAAMQQGRSAAANILHSLRGEPREPFVYRDKGMLATIGRKAAVGTIGKLRLSGFPAWLGWALVHLFYLVGFRNRILVFIEWAWAYFTYQRGARLITGPVAPTALPPPPPRP